MFRSRLLAGIAGIVLLAGCSLDIGGSLGFGGSTATQAQVVGDEPSAVKAGADILAQGGNAADAAAAMFLALSVTYPAAAGLGGGGVCIVHDPAKNISEEFVFMPKGDGAFAVPGNVRGFATLQGAYGAMPWAKVVAPAEGYARAGFPISRALRTRLGDAETMVRLDAGLAGEFMNESGQLKNAGSVVSNPELAETLAAIRAKGAEAFYSGKPAQAIAEYSAAQGGAISAGDLAAFKADRITPKVTQVGGNYVFLPAVSGNGAGTFAGVLIDVAAKAQSETSVSWPDAVQKALQSVGRQSPSGDLGATGFAVTDANGQAVACAVTMNGPFGSGHTVPGAGVTLAKADGVAPAAFLSPVIASPSADAPAVLAGAGAGGPNGSAIIADALLRLSRGEKIVTRDKLHSVAPAPYDTGNVIVCDEDACAAFADPSASGLGLAVPAQDRK